MYQHDPAEDNLRVNDIKLRERCTLSEDEQYHEQGPAEYHSLPLRQGSAHDPTLGPAL